MTLTKEKREEFEAVSRPLIQWLNENCHPHVVVIVEPARAELLEGICAYPAPEYLRD